MKTLTQIPLGTQVLFGKAARRRRQIERAIFSVFEKWKYEEIIPPDFRLLRRLQQRDGGGTGGYALPLYRS